MILLPSSSASSCVSLALFLDPLRFLLGGSCLAYSVPGLCKSCLTWTDLCCILLRCILNIPSPSTVH